MPAPESSPDSLRGRFARSGMVAALVVLVAVPAMQAQVPAEQAAQMLLTAARQAYNQKEFKFAADRFREFLAKHANHKKVPAARYGLALALVEGPDRDYAGAIEQLNALAGAKDAPDYPFVLYYLGLANRGQGVKLLAQAAQKPAEANALRAQAQQRFDDAVRHFAAAVPVFTARVKNPDPMAKEVPIDLEWAARARCDEAEMLLRAQKPREARDAVTPVLEDKLLARSRYRGLGLYYHGFSSFLLKENLAAGRSLSLLTPFADPVFGTHARYLLARIHHADGERAEAQGHYEGVISDHNKQKAAAVEALKDPNRFKNDPEEKARLEELVRGTAPDHVVRATFFLGVMQYENGQFAEAQGRFAEMVKQFPTSPLLPEAQLRLGFCHVQLKQFPEAVRTLAPLVDKEPRLADQALLWTARAQIGAADPANAGAYDQAVKTGLETLRKAVEVSARNVNSGDPEAKTRRGEILAETADALQLLRQYKEAAATYNSVISDKLLTNRDEELTLSMATALHLAGDFDGSDKACLHFRETFPRSTLTPAVLFRHAENAWFALLQAEKMTDTAARLKEVARLTDEAIKRYQAVADRYPDFAHVNLARYGLGTAYYRKGDYEKAKEKLETIPTAERNGELAVVPYQLADCLLRLAPAKVEDDAVAAGKLLETLKGAVELLEAYVGSQPNAAQTPDALLKLGFCHQRMAQVLGQPAEQAKELQAARAIYDQVEQRFRGHAVYPNAVFERAKVMAVQKDVGGAMNQLRQFQQGPLNNAPIAPMAVLHLATLLRGQNQAQQAADVLAQVRQQQEANLQKDPARAGWVPLLQYHHGVALREAGKRTEARAIFDQVVKSSPDRPEAAEAALRSGQCLKDEGQLKVDASRAKLANPGLKPEERAAAQKQLDDGIKEVRDAAAYLQAQAEQLKAKQPMHEARARMLYEAAWAHRAIAVLEVETARAKLQQDLWQKRRDEAAKRTPPGQPPPMVPMPVVELKDVPMQPSETAARAQYQALIEGFPDLAASADALFELAELQSERAEHDAAVKLLRAALDKEPNPELTDKVRVRLGNSLLLKGDAKAALAQFNAVAANPKSSLFAQASYRAGEALIQSGDHTGAVQRLAIFRDQQPYQNVAGVSDRALLRLGHALAALKQWEPSRQAHETLVNRFGGSPWLAEARYGIGWALQNQGRFDEAVQAYAQVTNLTATELGAQAQLNVGLCRLAQKKYPEATTAFLVVPFTYDYPHLSALALLEAARAHAENKQKDQAIKLLERVIRDHPDTDHADAAKKRIEELKKG
jgi:TolA-binding protein